MCSELVGDYAQSSEQINACGWDGMSEQAGSKSQNGLDFPAQPLYFSGLELSLESRCFEAVFWGSWQLDGDKSPFPPPHD